MENWPYDSPGRLYDIIAAMKIQRQELMVDVEHSSQREWTRETKQK